MFWGVSGNRDAPIIPVRAQLTHHLVAASSISLAPPQAAGLAHSAAAPLPTKSPTLRGPLVGGGIPPVGRARRALTKAPQGLPPRGRPCRARHRRAVGCAACGHPTASFRHGTILPTAYAPHCVASSLLRQRSKPLPAAAGTKGG